MTRFETISNITAQLERASDEVLVAVAEQLEAALDPIRQLTARELALVEQSKADFAHGRAYTRAEAEAHVERRLEEARLARAAE